MTAFDTTTAAYLINAAKDAGLSVTVSVRGIKGQATAETVTGDPISVNSKGVNLKVDGKVRSFSIGRIIDITSPEDMEVDTEVADRMEELANEVSDGASTAEVAALLSDYLEREITPKELRVHLRALGLGVGKGRKYALSAGEFRAVVKVLNADDVASVAN